jgi:hypothetical protein
MHFVNMCVKNQQRQQLFSLLCMVAPTCFTITLPSSGSVPSAFWEMLNWAVDGILWNGMLCLVTWCVTLHVTRQHVHPRYSVDFFLELLSEGIRNAPWDGNVMPKYVGDTIHN